MGLAETLKGQLLKYFTKKILFYNINLNDIIEQFESYKKDNNE